MDDDLIGIEFGDVVQTGVGTGGASTKVAAAKLAARSSTPVLLTSTDRVSEALAGDELGTWFEAVSREL